MEEGGDDLDQDSPVEASFRQPPPIESDTDDDGAKQRIREAQKKNPGAAVKEFGRPVRRTRLPKKLEDSETDVSFKRPGRPSSNSTAGIEKEKAAIRNKQKRLPKPPNCSYVGPVKKAAKGRKKSASESDPSFELPSRRGRERPPSATSGNDTEDEKRKIRERQKKNPTVMAKYGGPATKVAKARVRAPAVAVAVAKAVEPESVPAVPTKVSLPGPSRGRSSAGVGAGAGSRISLAEFRKESQESKKKNKASSEKAKKNGDEYDISLYPESDSDWVESAKESSDSESDLEDETPRSTRSFWGDRGKKTKTQSPRKSEYEIQSSAGESQSGQSEERSEVTGLIESDDTVEEEVDRDVEPSPISISQPLQLKATPTQRKSYGRASAPLPAKLSKSKIQEQVKSVEKDLSLAHSSSKAPLNNSTSSNSSKKSKTVTPAQKKVYADAKPLHLDNLELKRTRESGEITPMHIGSEDLILGAEVEVEVEVQDDAPIGIGSEDLFLGVEVEVRAEPSNAIEGTEAVVGVRGDSNDSKENSTNRRKEMERESEESSEEEVSKSSKDSKEAKKKLKKRKRVAMPRDTTSKGKGKANRVQVLRKHIDQVISSPDADSPPPAKTSRLTRPRSSLIPKNIFGSQNSTASLNTYNAYGNLLSQFPSSQQSASQFSQSRQSQQQQNIGLTGQDIEGQQGIIQPGPEIPEPPADLNESHGLNERESEAEDLEDLDQLPPPPSPLRPQTLSPERQTRRRRGRSASFANAFESSEEDGILESEPTSPPKGRGRHQLPPPPSSLRPLILSPDRQNRRGRSASFANAFESSEEDGILESEPTSPPKGRGRHQLPPPPSPLRPLILSPDRQNRRGRSASFANAFESSEDGILESEPTSPPKGRGRQTRAATKKPVAVTLPRMPKNSKKGEGGKAAKQLLSEEIEAVDPVEPIAGPSSAMHVHTHPGRPKKRAAARQKKRSRSPWGPHCSLMQGEGRVLYNRKLLSEDALKDILAKKGSRKLSPQEFKTVHKNMNSSISKMFDELSDHTDHSKMFYGVWSFKQFYRKLKKLNLLPEGATPKDLVDMMKEDFGPEGAKECEGVLFPKGNKTDTLDYFDN